MIQWGIIGCGDVTEVKSGPAFNKVPGSKLVAVMRRQAEKAKDYAMRHQVPKWYSNADELINDPEVNAIYVATPPLYHEEYALAAINAGKSVYLEKPMAMNAPSAKRISEAAQKKNIKISIAHYRRQQPKFIYIKKIIDNQLIGDVQSISLKLSQPSKTNLIARTEQPWRLDPSISGGGLFHDLSPHQLDLMLYFFGKPVHVTGTAGNNHHLYSADDTVSGTILFRNQIKFQGDWRFESNEKLDECRINGTKGHITFSIFEEKPVVILVNSEKQVKQFDPLPHVQQPMINKVVEYFSGSGSNPCPAEEGVIVMQMIDDMVRKKV